jgi:fatty-acyl-CoA synthase
LKHIVVDQHNSAAAERLSDLIPGLSWLSAASLASGGTARVHLPDLGPELLAVAQYTSGSTSRPKGVMLTHRAVLSVLLVGAQVHVFSPAVFLRRTAVVMEYFSQHRGTMMTGPNFSYDYVIDMVPPERLMALELSSWRLALTERSRSKQPLWSGLPAFWARAGLARQ